MSQTKVTYNVSSLQGDITIAPDNAVNYNGLELLGDGFINWGDEYNRNFVNLDDKITSKVLTDVPLNAVFIDTVFDDTEVKGLIDARGSVAEFNTAMDLAKN